MNPDPTIHTYDTYAHVYDAEVVDFWERFPAQTISAFQAALPGKKVLDLGSGSGRDALLLRDAGLDVTCLDASASMVALTEKLGFPTIQTDFKNLQLDNQMFDGIWAYTSLIHVTPDELVTTVASLRDVLPKNGIILLGLIKGNGAHMVKRPSMPESERYFHFYQAGQIDTLMQSAGFRLIFAEDYQPNTTVYLNRLYRQS